MGRILFILIALSMLGSIHHSFWARAYYAMQHTKGKGHHAAVRTLAFKLIRIIWKCWQTSVALQRGHLPGGVAEERLITTQTRGQ